MGRPVGSLKGHGDTEKKIFLLYFQLRKQTGKEEEQGRDRRDRNFEMWHVGTFWGNCHQLLGPPGVLVGAACGRARLRVPGQCPYFQPSVREATQGSPASLGASAWLCFSLCAPAAPWKQPALLSPWRVGHFGGSFS